MFLDSLLDSVKSIAPGVIGFAANTIVPGSGGFVNNLVRKVAGVSEDTPIEEAAEIIKKDPALYLQFQNAMLAQETKFRELDSEDLKTVNKTMRKETMSDKWWVSGWRPFNGFLYGITIFCTYFLLPVCKVAVPAVPIYVWIGWGAILGVTTWDRGKEKRAKVGDQTVGMVSNLVTNLVKRK